MFEFFVRIQSLQYFDFVLEGIHCLRVLILADGHDFEFITQQFVLDEVKFLARALRQVNS